ncbi:MAG: hypothetical protein P4L84_32905 [Isosphaeraceae bacterium]|nr:hypothetical protein [Isosphaeraceae bacterium]
MKASLLRHETVRRRGFTVFELAIAVILLSVAMTVTVQLLGAIALERRTVGRRELAAQEVANLMEHLTARPWANLTAESLKDALLSNEARQALPGAELKVGVEAADAPGGVPGKRVSIKLRWRNRAGEFDAPVRLTTWVYRSTAGRNPE